MGPIRSMSIFVVAGVLSGCTASAGRLSIPDAEAAGFNKTNQKIAALIGAYDGWTGTWAGETVELYAYVDTARAEEWSYTADNWADSGNMAGWQEVCLVQNMLMVSKGTQACRELESLE